MASANRLVSSPAVQSIAPPSATVWNTTLLEQYAEGAPPLAGKPSDINTTALRVVLLFSMTPTRIPAIVKEKVPGRVSQR